MKALPVIAIAAVLTLAAGAWFGARPPAEKAAEPVDAAGLHEGTLTTQSDPVAVFQRALWRRPAVDDKVLHAERREWTPGSAKGVAHWQWFLVVEQGAALKKWLRGQNPFALHPDKSGGAFRINGAPAWFPCDPSGCEVYSGGIGGNLVFFYSRTGDTLYATGSGTGFAVGAPEPSRPSQHVLAVSARRLPLTPPPVSTKP